MGDGNVIKIETEKGEKGGNGEKSYFTISPILRFPRFLVLRAASSVGRAADS
jgi:hypothetical protein